VVLECKQYRLDRVKCVCLCACVLCVFVNVVVFVFVFSKPKHGNIVLDQGNEGDICSEDRGSSGGMDRIVQ